MKSLRSSTAIRKPARTLPRAGAMKTTRTSLVIAAAAAGLVAAAGPAQADPVPTTEPRPSLCPVLTLSWRRRLLPVSSDYPILQPSKGTETTLPNGGEEFRFTGHAKAIVTSDGRGESITYNVSGPGTQTFYPRSAVDFTIDAAGPNLLFTTVENSSPGVPQLAYTTGRVRLAVDEDGQTTSYQLNGRSTDVCDELAA